jgi:predicted RNase H-like nuclease
VNKHKPTWLAGSNTDHLTGKVELDDVLDSLVGLSVAHALATDPGDKNRLPECDPPADERGLRMEIWF